MAITEKNLPKHELIGLHAEVKESTDPNQEGIKGEILDETKNTLRIDGKQVEKENCTFLIEIPSGEKVQLEGEHITKRPAERARMKTPNKWKT